MVRVVEGVDKGYGTLPQDGTQVVDFGTEVVHLGRRVESELEEVLSVLLDGPGSVESAEESESRDDSVGGVLGLLQLWQRLAELTAMGTLVSDTSNDDGGREAGTYR